jgi:hypothetical protein
MPRQNRITPFGDIIATDARGHFMGNRGILHDDQGNLTAKRWTHPNWVACRTEFKGIRQPINAPGSYTQLFFLDEATALAAGHRPCGYCRRDDFICFREAWLRGNPPADLDDTATMGAIDRIIHAKRVTRNRGKVTYRELLANLPDGVFVTLPENPQVAQLIWHGSLHHWASAGYLNSLPLPQNCEVSVLTPQSIVRAIAAGYVPQVAIAS